MKITINTIKKTVLLTGGLFLSVLSVNADDVQDKLNFNYLRTPEAAAFMKYGEESVNEYTGTADISVPLYTIKCKDIEIPLVLRYDASGIKVEQDASWVGLGWNLMVGGCINYVCAGGHDQLTQAAISDKTWKDYLTTRKTTNSYRTLSENIKTWMETVNHSFAFEVHNDNLSQDMKNYLMWGYGERDFYSVNILGKSFKFFIDPSTLRPHIIGEAGENYKIEGDYNENEKGIGHQFDVGEWKITDASGYIYHFSNGDLTENGDGSGRYYKFCWYLTEIETPLGEKVRLSYTKHQEYGRMRMTESFSLLSERVSTQDARFGSQGYSKILPNSRVSNSYLKEIKTNNQTVIFSTTENKECSGRKLDAITIKSNDGTIQKNIKFSYSTFGLSTTGGNYATGDKETHSDYRLKLNNVKEIASSETLTTSFEYNTTDLPSKRSCAQDFWGYYNGQDNPSTSQAYGNKGHTMLPAPKNFMTKNFDTALNKIKGANRESDGYYMQAAILKKIVYPTGGYTTYEYEPNSCKCITGERPYDINIYKYYTYTPDVPAGVSPVTNTPYDFTLTEELDFTLYVEFDGDAMIGKSINAVIAPMNFITPIVIPVKCQSSNELKIVLQDKLPAGNYQLIIGASGEGTKGYGICCRLAGYYKSNTPDKPVTKTVGGLRVKTISNFDNDNKPINYTTYDYNNSGILLNEIETIDGFSYTYLNPGQNGWGPACVYSRHQVSGWNITTGHSRFPAFYESCNPGIVGYSKVTKCKYNANKILEKSIVTSYRNHRPKSLTLIDYYDCLDNGKMLSQETRDANGKVILEVKNDYRTHELENDEEKDRWYCTNMIAHDNIIIGQGIQYIDEKSDPIFESRFQVWKYPYILSRVDLTKTTTTEYCADGKKIVRTKEYKYKNNNENIQLCQTDESTSLSSQTKRTKITYTSDGTDVASRSMTSQHRLNDVVENKVVLVENGKEQGVSTQRTNYTSRSRNGAGTPPLYYLPRSCSTSIGNAAPEERVKYTYDDSLNVRSIAIDGMETVYLWSYKGQYPIAKIEGLTYAEVENAITKTTISELLRSQTPNSTTVSSIRTKINNKGGYITTYTYKPLVGMLSETQPNGNVIYYEYDSFGRLKNIKDYNKKIIKTYEYHYSDKK